MKKWILQGHNITAVSFKHVAEIKNHQFNRNLLIN